MPEIECDFSTKKEMLKKMRAYAETPDDANIRFKQLIKEKLLGCPELLYALHNKELESELFDNNGKLNTEGEWDRYFGNNSNIRPFVFFPEVQTDVENYLCYQTRFDSAPRHNPNERYGEIVFTIFINGSDVMDRETGIPRHDLIASILRERFNWGNVFSAQCKIVSDKEATTDTKFVTRTLVFELTMLNSLVKTTNGKTRVINKEVRR